MNLVSSNLLVASILRQFRTIWQRPFTGGFASSVPFTSGFASSVHYL